MIYAIMNYDNGNMTYIKAKSGYEALERFLKGIKSNATIMVHENFCYAIVDNTTYSVRRRQ